MLVLGPRRPVMESTFRALDAELIRGGETVLEQEALYRSPGRGTGRSDARYPLKGSRRVGGEVAAIHLVAAKRSSRKLRVAPVL